MKRLNDTLSPCERRTLQLIARGLSSKEITVQMEVKLATVYAYRERIRDKLGVNDQAGYQRKAAELCLIEAML